MVSQVNECRQLLFDLAVSAGVRIDKNTAVTKVKPSDNAQDPRPSVTTSKGEVIQADLVVCSEGARGPLRSQVFGEYVERPTDFALYVADVPLGPLRTDPELKSVIDSEQVNLDPHRDQTLTELYCSTSFGCRPIGLLAVCFLSSL